MTINISLEYTKSPGGRYVNEGEYSGEHFRDNILFPAYEKCKNTGEKLTVILDGGYGYGSSFLEEAFGGLARETNDTDILNIILVSDEEPRLIDDIIGYMKDGLKNINKNT